MATSQYSFKEYRSLSLRLWHWANSVVILGLLGTVLIRKSFLSWRTNSVVIQEKLDEAGVSISSELARQIAVAIRAPLWNWHIYLGFSLALLLLVRFWIAIFAEKQWPGLASLKQLFQWKKIPPHQRISALHFNSVKIGYGVFVVVTLVMVITGLLLTFKTEMALSKDVADFTKEIHEFLMWFFLIFVAGHIVGIVIAENRNNQGLVSDMIHGGKKP